MTGQKVVKVFCYENAAIAEFETLSDHLCQVQRKHSSSEDHGP